MMNPGDLGQLRPLHGDNWTEWSRRLWSTR